MQNEIYKLKDELKEQNKIIEQNDKKINKLEYDVTEDIKLKIASNYALCKYGYYLYAFECENMRYKCSISRQKDFETLTKNLKDIDSNGEMKYYVKVSYPFSEKIMMFILKQRLILLGNNKFEGSYEDVKQIIDITAKLENILIDNCNNLDNLSNILNNQNSSVKLSEDIDPEVPLIRKAKRSIDQINKDTGEVINTFESIEAAARSLGLTTGTAVGIALREKRVCQGFLWRYSGISKEEQFLEQPVIKVCCSTGEKHFFKTIADAARDVKISAPALRQRILTHVHINEYHWVFDKTSTHYKYS